jgi:hypothetical protein
MHGQCSVVRALVVGALLAVGGALLTASCVEPESFATLTSGGGANGVPPEATFDALSPQPDMDAVASAPPDVRCTDVPFGDAAAARDGGDADAEAGADCRIPPPPLCLSSLLFATYAPGRCTTGRCTFTETRRQCPKGCFRQLDGGPRCLQ